MELFLLNNQFRKQKAQMQKKAQFFAAILFCLLLNISQATDLCLWEQQNLRQETLFDYFWDTKKGKCSYSIQKTQKVQHISLHQNNLGSKEKVQNNSQIFMKEFYDDLRTVDHTVNFGIHLENLWFLQNGYLFIYCQKTQEQHIRTSLKNYHTCEGRTTRSFQTIDNQNSLKLIKDIKVQYIGANLHRIIIPSLKKSKENQISIIIRETMMNHFWNNFLRQKFKKSQKSVENKILQNKKSEQIYLNQLISVTISLALLIVIFEVNSTKMKNPILQKFQYLYLFTALTSIDFSFSQIQYVKYFLLVMNKLHIIFKQQYLSSIKMDSHSSPLNYGVLFSENRQIKLGYLNTLQASLKGVLAIFLFLHGLSLLIYYLKNGSIKCNKYWQTIKSSQEVKIQDNKTCMSHRFIMIALFICIHILLRLIFKHSHALCFLVQMGIIIYQVLLYRIPFRHILFNEIPDLSGYQSIIPKRVKVSLFFLMSFSILNNNMKTHLLNQKIQAQFYAICAIFLILQLIIGFQKSQFDNKSSKNIKESKISDQDKQICIICFQPLTTIKDDDFIVETECEHVYHGSCLFEWSKISQTCPIDRNNLDLTLLYQQKSKGL